MNIVFYDLVQGGENISQRIFNFFKHLLSFLGLHTNQDLQDAYMKGYEDGAQYESINNREFLADRRSSYEQACEDAYGKHSEKTAGWKG